MDQTSDDKVIRRLSELNIKKNGRSPTSQRDIAHSFENIHLLGYSSFKLVIILPDQIEI